MKHILPALLLLLTACSPAIQSTETSIPATQTAALATPTQAPTASNTPIPPTDTPTVTVTSTPTDTPTPTATETPLPTDTPEPSATPRPTRTPAPTVAVQSTATSAPTQAATVAQPTTTLTPQAALPKANITLVIQKIGYDNWGRPKSMDDPNATSCGPFDDSHRMLRLLISLAATNNTGQDWPEDAERIGFFKTDGSLAHWCYYDFLNGGKYPVVHQGDTFQITFVAFVERNERVKSVVFLVEDIGYAEEQIPADLPIPQ